MSSRYINGFIAGGLIGAATAIIFSSKSENDMKNKMMIGGRNIADAASRIIPNIKAK